MTRFYIQNVHTGKYFLLPGHGTTSCRHCAHIYTQDEVNNPKNPHLVRSLGRGITQRVPVTEPALAGEQGGNHA